MTTLSKASFAKLAKNKKVSEQNICDIIFSEICVAQEAIIQQKVSGLRQDISFRPQHYHDTTLAGLEKTLLVDVTEETKEYINSLVGLYVDNILDARNEELISIEQMNKLMSIMNSIKEVVDQEM